MPEIGEQLFVTRNTVKSQAISLYRKLDTSSRSAAIAKAVELGLIDAPGAATAESAHLLGMTPGDVVA